MKRIPVAQEVETLNISLLKTISVWLLSSLTKVRHVVFGTFDQISFMSEMFNVSTS